MGAAISAATKPVEKSLVLPTWHAKHDQGEEGACVGFGTSMMLSILHEGVCRSKGDKTPYVRYNPWWLWDSAKVVDEFPDSNPGDGNGTTVSAACKILTTQGHVVWMDEEDRKSIGPVDSNYGIDTVRWAQTVDEMRAAIAKGVPMSIGVNWYANFFTPTFDNSEYWIGKTGDLGVVRGGHCVAVYGASDERQAFRIKNSWGITYPEVWMPYSIMDRLLREGGEIALVTDK